MNHPLLNAAVRVSVRRQKGAHFASHADDDLIHGAQSTDHSLQVATTGSIIDNILAFLSSDRFKKLVALVIAIISAIVGTTGEPV